MTELIERGPAADWCPFFLAGACEWFFLPTYPSPGLFPIPEEEDLTKVIIDLKYLKETKYCNKLSDLAINFKCKNSFNWKVFAKKNELDV